MHVLWICPQVAPHFNTVVLLLCDCFWQIWMRPRGWWVGFPDVLLFHSSVKLSWIDSCFMECDHPLITDVLFASEICLYLETVKRLCFLCFMMLFCIFIATFVWVLSIKYTFYVKSRFQCLWLGPSEAWILIHYCTLKHSSALVCVAMQETFGRAKWKNEINWKLCGRKCFGLLK